MSDPVPDGSACGPVVVTGAFSLVICALQIFAVIGPLAAYIEFLYVFGLYWLLGMCFLNFLMLFFRVRE